MRLDKYLLEKGFFTSREKAQTAIKHNTVKVNGAICAKASADVDETSDIEVIDIFNKYVSMGGLKLEKAINDFGLDFSGKSVLDIGSSTGGFTDCALQHGASFVTAVDVGTAQLDQTLQGNSEIQSIENKDFRELSADDVNGRSYDFVVSDVSFISLTHIIPHIPSFLAEGGSVVLLVKPQFEAGQSFLSKNGIVTEEKGYKTAIQKVVGEALNHKLFVHNITVSTLFEKHKNVEFLLLLSAKPSNYSIRYNDLFAEVKRLKKNTSGGFDKLSRR